MSNVPCIIAVSTSITEARYIGEDAESIATLFARK